MYCIAREFDEELNLAVWQSVFKTVKLNPPNYEWHMIPYQITNILFGPNLILTNISGYNMVCMYILEIFIIKIDFVVYGSYKN